MTKKQKNAIASKYRVSPEERAIYEKVRRANAYGDLLVVIGEDEFYGIETSDDDVERIIDDYLDGECDDQQVLEDNERMRKLIRRHCKKEYDVEVRTLCFKNLRIRAYSEEQAHSEAHLSADLMSDVISIKQTTITNIDGKEISTDTDDHTIEYD